MLEQAEQQTKIAMQLIMLTFVRNGELRTAEWAEFDLDGAEWSIPAAKMKMKAPHIVPLADWTLELLVEMKELTGYSLSVPIGKRPWQVYEWKQRDVFLHLMSYGSFYAVNYVI